MIHLAHACRGRTAAWFPANSSHMCYVELALDRLLFINLGSKGFLRRGFSLFLNPTTWLRWRYAREVLARPWVGVCVPLVLSLHYFQCNRIKFNLFFIIFCIS